MMEGGTSSKRHLQSLQSLNELFKKDDDELHLLFPQGIKQGRKNKITSIALKIKKRFSIDYGCESNIQNQESTIRKENSNYQQKQNNLQIQNKFPQIQPIQIQKGHHHKHKSCDDQTQMKKFTTTFYNQQNHIPASMLGSTHFQRFGMQNNIQHDKSPVQKKRQYIILSQDKLPHLKEPKQSQFQSTQIEFNNHLNSTQSRITTLPKVQSFKVIKTNNNGVNFINDNHKDGFHPEIQKILKSDQFQAYQISNHQEYSQNTLLNDPYSISSANMTSRMQNPSSLSNIKKQKIVIESLESQNQNNITPDINKSDAQRIYMFSNRDTQETCLSNNMIDMTLSSTDNKKYALPNNVGSARGNNNCEKIELFLSTPGKIINNQNQIISVNSQDLNYDQPQRFKSIPKFKLTLLDLPKKKVSQDQLNYSDENKSNDQAQSTTGLSPLDHQDQEQMMTSIQFQTYEVAQKNQNPIFTHSEGSCTPTQQTLSISQTTPHLNFQQAISNIQQKNQKSSDQNNNKKTNNIQNPSKIHRIVKSKNSSPKSNQTPLIKINSTKQIQEFISNYKMKLGIRDQEEINYEINQINNRVKQWKEKRNRFHVRPEDSCLRMQIEIQKQMSRHQDSLMHLAGSQTQRISLVNNHDRQPQLIQKKNSSKIDVISNLNEEIKTQREPEELKDNSQQKTPLLQKNDIIKLPKFNSQNVSIVSLDSPSRNYDKNNQSPNSISHPQFHIDQFILKNPNDEYQMNEQQLLERLQDGIKLNGQGSFIHNTLKSIYRRASLMNIEDRKINKIISFSEKQSPGVSPSKLIQNQARETVFSQSPSFLIRNQSLIIPKLGSTQANFKSFYSKDQL